MDKVEQFWISFGVTVYLFTFVCMIISFHKARKRKKGYINYLCDEDVHFIGVCSWIGIVTSIIGVMILITFGIRDILF